MIPEMYKEHIDMILRGGVARMLYFLTIYFLWDQLCVYPWKKADINVVLQLTLGMGRLACQ